MEAMICSREKLGRAWCLAAVLVMGSGCGEEACPDGEVVVDGEIQAAPRSIDVTGVDALNVEVCSGIIPVGIYLMEVAAGSVTGQSELDSQVTPIDEDGGFLSASGTGSHTTVADIRLSGFEVNVVCDGLSDTDTNACTGYYSGALFLANEATELTSVTIEDSRAENASVFITSYSATLTDVTFHRNHANGWGAALGVWAQTDFTATNLDLGSGEDDNAPAETELAIFDYTNADDPAVPQLVSAYSFDEPVDLHCFGGTCELL
jgi:hypothetical protein